MAAQTVSQTYSTYEKRWLPTVLVGGDWTMDDDCTRYLDAFAAKMVGMPWNGWSVPAFTRSVAEAFVAHQATMCEKYGEETLRLEWDGDVIRATTNLDGEPDYVQVIVPEPAPDGECVWWLDLGLCWEDIDINDTTYPIDTVHGVTT